MPCLDFSRGGPGWSCPDSFLCCWFLLFFPSWWSSKPGKSFDREWEWEEARVTAAPSESVLLLSRSLSPALESTSRNHVGLFPFQMTTVPQQSWGSRGRDGAKYSSCSSLRFSIKFLSRIWWVLFWGYLFLLYGKLFSVFPAQGFFFFFFLRIEFDSLKGKNTNEKNINIF